METPRSSSISPHDPTLQLSDTDRPEPPGESVRHEQRLCGKLGLVEGGEANLSCQTRDLLRVRLGAVAAVYLCGFVVFLLWGFLARALGQVDLASSVDLPLQVAGLFYFHVLAVIVLAAVCVALFQQRPLPAWALGLAELVVFGLPAAFFLTVDYHAIRVFAERGHPLNPLVPWLCMIMLYAMFIPNTWRRAMPVIAALAASPIVLMVYLRVQFEAVHATIAPNMIVNLGLGMAITAVAATLGTHMIGALRRQVYEARQLGQYHLVRRLGVGGMGEVYLAEHQLLKRPCALKLIRPGSAADPQAIARFEREVKTTATLTHPNTVEIYDYGHTEDGTFYYVMEYLPGLTLADLVERHGPLPPQRVVYLLRQACDALREAHSAGLIHRDIKPANIFVAERGGVHDVVKLLDFGLVKGITQERSAELTQDGTVAGSPLFMAPEQAMGQQPDARADIYALGAVMYYLLTGRPPFEGDSPMKVIVAHAHDPVVRPSQVREGVPADVEQVVLKCLEKEPDHRYQSALGVGEALGGCEAAGIWTPRQADVWWHEHAE